MSIIKNMYYGELFPLWERYPDTKEYAEKTKEILDIQRELLGKFPDVKEYLERYFEAQYGAANEFGFQQFQMGVRVGAQLMLEMIRKVEK